MTLLLVLSLVAGLRVPEGFTVSLIADHTVANDIHCLTLTPDGRIVVSGRGYVRLLDGSKVTEFTGAPKDGAMGLCWDQGDLYAVGDGGLRVWRGADPTRPPELIFKCRTGSEHLAHAVQRGPDGWLYLLVGDQTGISARDITSDDSPIKEPIGGCVLRLSPDEKRVEVFAHGFRNAYGMDFGSDGELYTYDSDNERCVGLPWYEPTRFYRVVRGGHHGWLGPKLASTYRLPPYYPDVVPPVANLGRGSPTGVVVYKHASFPRKYRGGAFACDWTFGVIHFVPLNGDKPEVFLRATGGDGFAPTAMAVHPATGDLLVSIGGRGTRGGIYRISHPDGLKSLDRKEVERLTPRPARPKPPPRVLPSAEAITLVSDIKRTPKERLGALRQVQLFLGGPPTPAVRGTVWEGYTRARTTPVPIAVREGLRAAFPSGEATLDVELARTLALLEDDSPAVTRTVVSKLGAKSSTSDIHYLAVLARLRGAFDVVPVVDALLTLDARLPLRPDTNWPLRIAEISIGLTEREPKLRAALLAEKRFGRPEHVVFLPAIGSDRRRAAERFLARSKEADFTWNSHLVRLIAELPAEHSLPVLRSLWGRAGVDEAIVPILARAPEVEDRSKMLSALTSARLDLVQVALGGLEKLGPSREETLTLIRALVQVPPDKAGDRLRERLTTRLEKASRHKEANLTAWLTWARKEFPDQAASLRNLDGVDEEAWAKRVNGIDWSRGDAKRGAAVLIKASCASCHSGAAALGPDLAGVGKRFSRDDLLTAIVRPSKDVSERYRTTRVTTGRGVVHVGVIVYEAVDGMILQTGPGETVRVPGVPEKAPSARSIMPTGLLDRLSDEEIADLIAHLSSR